MVRMNRAPAPSAVSAPNDAARPRATVGAPSDVWVRTLPLWHVWNVGTIVVASAGAMTSWPMSGTRTLAAVGLVGVMLGLYAAVFLRHPRLWGWWLPWAVPYAAAIMVCFGALLQLNPYFAYLEFSLYPQLFFLLYARRRAVAVGAFGLVLAMTLGELSLYGWRLADAGPHLLPDYLQVGFAFVMSLWIGAMATQSAERRQLIGELERTRHDLAAAEREAGVLEERSRLAREIHDTLAQGFASIVAHMEAASASRGQDEERVARHIREAEEVARQSLAEARGLAWALRPDALASGGLPAAIERAVAAALPDDRPASRFTVTGPVRQLHPEVEVTILRAAQESLTNVRRHAGANVVDVTLTYFDDGISLDVADDGRGFDPAAAGGGPAGGLGLAGMRERAEALGGSLAVESSPGVGTTVAVHVPTADRTALATAVPVATAVTR
jgi:signal transduction histidine kinase